MAENLCRKSTTWGVSTTSSAASAREAVAK